MKSIKIILTLMLCVCVLILCGCKNKNVINVNNGSDQGTTAPDDSDPTISTSGNQTISGESSFDNVDWEGPIDVDGENETLPPQTLDSTEPPIIETNPEDPTDPPIKVNHDTGAIELPLIPG